MRRSSRLLVAMGIALMAAATAAQAYTPGALLIVQPGVGVREWLPGAATSSLVIPLPTANAVAVDAVGNALVAAPGGAVRLYSPSGSLLGLYEINARDIAVGPSGSLYAIRNSVDEIWQVDPPALLASAIQKMSGIAVTRDPKGNDVVLVTSSANGGELLRVWPGPTVVLRSGLGTQLKRPQLDRFGNLLVASEGQLLVLDPPTGATRGTFASGSFINVTDSTATSGDRYFVSSGSPESDCVAFEIAPIDGALISSNVIPECTDGPSALVAVPGGTPAPKLAKNDLVLTDPGAFGGAGAVLRIDPATGAPRPLLLGGNGNANALAPVSLGIGPTHEIAYTALFGATEDRILRVDPKTGRTSLVYTGARGIAGPAYDHRGHLYFNDGHVQRVDRTTGALEGVFDPFDADVFALLVHADSGFPSQIDDTVVGSLARSGGSVLARDTYLAYEPAFGEYWTSLGYLVVPVAPPLINVRTFGGRAISSSSPPGLYFPFHQVSIPIPDAVSPRGVAARRSPTGTSWDAHYMADSGAYGGGGAVFQEQGGVVTRLTTATFVDPLAIEVVPSPSCGDGLDNDDDGQIDFPADTGCASADDPWETVDCSDGIDNDLDGTVDYVAGAGDPSCSSALFGIESTQCSNGADDDGDGRIDASDAQCSGLADDREAPNPSGCGLLGIEGLAVLAWAARRKVGSRRRDVRRAGGR